ncbi:iron-containing alcohol dehydrogenase family protein [Haloarchaeobius salinus]|uniref:iron-containing alcohol dehydrogenase family protein n=1 Tax=Haloarchaeobius salinus TaxID=1198298 RepID=UPI00210C70C4|nr:iron-containing alcohol dehydrogenase family protein [Haloarchaeobius salinus]
MTTPLEINVPKEFEYAYGPSTVRYGAGCVESIETVLARADVERALVVTGKTVGKTPAVIDPVTEGAGDRLAGVFAETTPEKSIDTVLAGVKRMEAVDADGLLTLGGGSSMDVARAMSVVAAEDGEPRSFHAQVGADGTVEFPTLDEPKPPVFAVPTTYSGAELTSAAGVNYPATDDDGGVREGPIYDPKVVPQALFYDPELLASTPERILTASAMNGMDHGIEMLYSRHANPLTDAVAIHGLRILDNTLPRLADADHDTLGAAAVGVYLTSYGLIDPVANANKYNIIHAFGHIISRRYPIQQGAVHGIVAPHVLRHLFTRDIVEVTPLARAFGVTDATNPAAAVVERVRAIRDALDLPDGLKPVEGVERAALPEIANAITQDVGLQNGPTGFEPTTADVVKILEAAW